MRHINLFVILFCIVVLISGYVLAQQEQLSVSEGPIKIPPPIEGIPSPYEREAEPLPVEIIAILGRDGVQISFSVEVASDSVQQKQGLMYRNKLDSDKGMLFMFEDSAERSFWMKNTYIPLDILFIRDDGVIHYIHEMAEPRSLSSIKSNGETRAALEIAGGEAQRQGINIGDRILSARFDVSEEGASAK